MFDLPAWWRDFARAFKELKNAWMVAALFMFFDVTTVLCWDRLQEMAAEAGLGGWWSWWEWSIAACMSITLMIFQELIFAHSQAMARHSKPPLETAPSVSIDRRIFDRWSKVRARYAAIDPGDSRAQLEAFPAQLALILELDRVRGLSAERTTRRRLRKRIGTIMRECLSPLAAEIQAQKEFDARYNQLLANEAIAETEALAAVRAEASELHQCAVEEYAQELLRTT